MINFKVLAALLVSALPAVANPHADLVRAVESVGISVRFNVDECDANNSFGWYHGLSQSMVVCQENKVKGSDKFVQFTAEDFDTIRHEAHHVVQDCMDNKVDGLLQQVYTNPGLLADDKLTQQKADWIVRAYRNRGYHIVYQELEAFAVAAMNNPEEQVRDVKKYCLGE